MKILVLNAGSSSLKFTMYRMEGEEVLAKGIVERIGLDAPLLKYESPSKGDFSLEVEVKNHTEAMKLICDALVDSEHGVLESLADVEAIGHRIVHGGESFTKSALITTEIKQTIEACFPLAPLHNPPNLGGVLACEELFDGIPNVAVFDTAFHQTMPPSSYLYAVPYELYEKEGIRKYGFHGTSHRFISAAAAEFIGKPIEELNLITCHLGNGCSIAAVQKGKVLDTSMGMTPLAGLVMGTRCGDIDPGVVLHLIKSGHTPEEVDNLLNKKSGLLGVGNIGSSDMRDIIKAIDEGNELAKRAFDTYVYRIVSYIGAYYTVLGKADAVIFTGGVGENSLPVRAAIVSGLESLGCYLDEEKNVRGISIEISKPESTLRAIIIPTDEELMIARDTQVVVADA